MGYILLTALIVSTLFVCFITSKTVPKKRYTRLAQFIIDKGLFDEFDKELWKDSFKNYQ